MTKPVCVPCGLFFRVKKNGFVWVESKPIANNAPAGKGRPELWTPYKLHSSDLWQCKGCGAQVLTGHGFAPISYDHQPGFAEMIVTYGSQLTVNDC